MWWVVTYFVGTIFFLAGYVTGQGFRRYREADERDTRDSMCFLSGFYAAYNPNLNREHHEQQHTSGE